MEMEKEDQGVVNADGDADDNISDSDSDSDSEGKKRKERPWEKEQDQGNMQPPSSSSMPSTEPSVKRRRTGRSRGTGKLQQIAAIGGDVAETAGGRITPYVVTVQNGEDVVNKISAYFQKGPQAFCILSATGVVSKVVIRNPSNDTLRFEGLFEILSLSGSYTYHWGNNPCRRSKKAMLNISLAHSDGRVFGGALQGPLIAAGPVQIVLARFEQNVSKRIMRTHPAGSSAAPNMSSDPDQETFNQNVPRMIEGEQSFPSPTSGLIPTTSALPENTIAATTTTASDDVIPASQNVHSVSEDDVGPDS